MRSSQRVVAVCVLAVLAFAAVATAQDPEIAKKLEGFDAYMAKVLKDWNAPGIGVGIVVGDKLVFAKGYGYRDYEQEAALHADDAVPDRLEHQALHGRGRGPARGRGQADLGQAGARVGPLDPVLQRRAEQHGHAARHAGPPHRHHPARHDLVQVGLHPQGALRAAEVPGAPGAAAPDLPLQQPDVRRRRLHHRAAVRQDLGGVRPRAHLQAAGDEHRPSTPSRTCSKQPDFGVPFTEKRDTFELYQIPYYEDTAGVAPAGAIISNIEDMSHWLIALMNDGKYGGKQVLPADVLKATLEPAIALPNTVGETRGCWELLNAAYGMGRWTASYRGHLLTYHGGDLDGFHSQVSFMPHEHDRRDRLRHRRPLRQPLQHRQLQRLRAPARDGPDPLERAAARDPAEGQEGGHRGAGQGRRRARPRTPSPRTRSPDYVGRLRAPRLRRPEDRPEGRRAPVRLPQDQASR